MVTNVRQMQLNIEMLLKELVAALEDLFAKARGRKEYFYQVCADLLRWILTWLSRRKQISIR